MRTASFPLNTGDTNHEVRLQQAVEQGYKATLRIYDYAAARVNNQGVVVLMEKERLLRGFLRRDQFIAHRDTSEAGLLACPSELVRNHLRDGLPLLLD